MWSLSWPLVKTLLMASLARGILPTAGPYSHRRCCDWALSPRSSPDLGQMCLLSESCCTTSDPSRQRTRMSTTSEPIHCSLNICSVCSQYSVLIPLTAICLRSSSRTIAELKESYVHEHCLRTYCSVSGWTFRLSFHCVMSFFLNVTQFRWGVWVCLNYWTFYSLVGNLTRVQGEGSGSPE